MAKRTGTSGPDTDQTIRPTPRNDVIRTLDGDDNVTGGRGNDRIDGGRGNDVLAGQEGNDTLRGGAGDDTLQGGIGKDKLVGGPGNDTLVGDGGKDSLRGGPGSDHFIVTKAGEDRILDYNPGEDEITVLKAGPVERPPAAAPREAGPREEEPPDDKPAQPTPKGELPDYYGLLDRGITWTGDWRTLDNGLRGPWDDDNNKPLGQGDDIIDSWDSHYWYPEDLERLNHLLSGGDPYEYEVKRADGPDQRADFEALKALLDEYPPDKVFQSTNLKTQWRSQILNRI